MIEEALLGVHGIHGDKDEFLKEIIFLKKKSN